MTNLVTIPLEMHAKQAVAFETPATEVLYGGAAGGGKSWLMRAAAIVWCAAIPGLQVYIFRRISDDLIRNHVEGPKGFRALLAPWVTAGFCRIVEDEIRFWNGSKIYLCHCKDESDRFKYQGAEIHLLLIDELTHFTEVIYRFLRSRVRMIGINLPPEYAGKFPRILCGSNPGSVGHHWVKATFIDRAVPLEVVRTEKSEGGMLRQYIPAKLEDNPSMASDDPSYEDRLSGLGSDALVKAMRDGNWDVVAGAFFDCWATDKHVIRPFAVPQWWLRFMSFDWGSAKPFSVGWWAVSDGNFVGDKAYPTGALIRYREWYGAKGPNEGLSLATADIAAGIRAREALGEKITYRVADPACWKVDGGPSHAETMANNGVIMRRADNSRIAGWTQLRDRLLGQDGEPMLYVFHTCLDLIRTLPAIQHDEHRPEDVDSDAEDHAPDECFVAGTMVETERGPKPIETVSVGDRVMTRVGWQPVAASFTVGMRQVFNVSLSDGTVLTGTASHPIWVDGAGFIPLSELRYADMMCPLWSQSLAIPSKNSAGASITNAAYISSRAASDCIVPFGNFAMAASHVARIFTTSILTRVTTLLRTWFALPGMSTCLITGNSDLERQQDLSSMRALAQPGGMGLKLGSSGTGSNTNGIVRRPLLPRWLSALVSDVPLHSWRGRPRDSAPMHANPHGGETIGSMGNRDCARDAAPNSGLINIRLSVIAASRARLLAHMKDLLVHMFAGIAGSNSAQKIGERFGAPTVVGTPTSAGFQRVYNLTVDGAEEYFANGVLVHNCRYACMSRPWTRRPEVVLPIRSAADMTMAEAWKLGAAHGKGARI